ncbi:MAG: peptide chain release factor N(5)-glutamine methyltransferase [Microthrixaceae bacterium]
MSPAPDGTVTWRELLAEAVGLLSAAPALRATAEVDARWMVADCMGVAAAELSSALGASATERGVARFDEMVRRRCQGEPLQYVLGSWGFRTLDLMVDERVLIPRPETEAVVEVALGELDRLDIRDRAPTVIDLGTGSGAIALSIAVERVRVEVWATDVSRDALAVARANTAGIGRPGAWVRLAEGEWFAALPSKLAGSVDMIVSNPPYVASSATLPSEVENWEPGPALWSGPDGTDDLRSIIAGAAAWLRDQGVLVCELSPEQAEPMRQLALEHFTEASVRSDLTGRPRALVARLPQR